MKLIMVYIGKVQMYWTYRRGRHMDKMEIIGSKVCYWLIRTGVNGVCFEKMKNDNVIAIGWDRIGKLDEDGKIVSQEDVKKLVEDKYRDMLLLRGDERDYKRKISDIAAKIYKFTYEVKCGDYVVCPGNTTVLIGKISGDVYTVKGKYESSNKDDNGMGELNKARNVKWIKEIEKDKLEPNIKLELRVIHGLFQITREQVITEINRAIYDLYDYKNNIHAIFRIRSTSEISFDKYANFIACVDYVYKQLNIDNQDLYIKTNINSPGPIEFIGKKGQTVCKLTRIVDIILNGKRIPDDLKSEMWIEQKKKEYSKYDYNDYDFPSGGQV